MVVVAFVRVPLSATSSVVVRFSIVAIVDWIALVIVPTMLLPVTELPEIEPPVIVGFWIVVLES